MVLCGSVCIVSLNNLQKRRVQQVETTKRTSGISWNLDLDQNYGGEKWKKKQMPWQKNQPSQRIFHIFLVFCCSRIFLLGFEPPITKILVKLDLWNHHPDLICIVYIYLSQKEVTSISINRCTLPPQLCPLGLSVEISHQTWSLSSFLSENSMNNANNYWQ